MSFIPFPHPTGNIQQIKYLGAGDRDHGVICHLPRLLLGLEECEVVGACRVLLDKHLPAGKLLLKLDGPSHLVHADESCVVQSVGVKFKRRLGTLGVSSSLQQSSFLI